MKTLLFPLDGTPLAEEALSSGLRQYAPEDLRVILLTCLDLNLMLANAFEFAPQTIEELRERDKRSAQDYLDGQVRRLSELGYSARGVVNEGSPVEGILRAAQEHHADQIVLVSHGREGLARLFLGSVAEGVIRKADRPVVVIPPAQRLHHNDESTPSQS